MFARMTIRMNEARKSSMLQNIGAYLASEASAKLSRIVAVIVMARVLQPVEVGIVAAAMATSELLKAFTENGVIQRVISASDSELEATCRTANRINWIWCGGLFALQLLVAGGVYALMGNAAAALLIAVMALEYLLMPPGLVHCGLAMRDGKLKGTAFVAGAQTVSANLLSALLLIVWYSPATIALARVASAPIWTSGMRYLHPWRPTAGPRAPLTPFLRFGRSVVGVELVKALRMQSDKFLIGGLLGADALGFYYFAVNAGLGIANSFSVAFATVLFPHFRISSGRDAVLRSGLLLALFAVTPVVAMQALAAPVYVPLIFGEKWAPVAPLVSLLCFLAIPSVIWATTAQWFRAMDRADIELRRSVVIFLAASGAIVAAYPFGLTGVAWALLLATGLTQLALSLPAFSAAFARPARALNPAA